MYKTLRLVKFNTINQPSQAKTNFPTFTLSLHQRTIITFTNIYVNFY